MNYTWAKKNDIEYDVGTPKENISSSCNFAIFDHMKNCAGFVRSSREAQVFAAAPDMLSALNDCLLYLDQEQFGPGDEPFDGNIREIICHAIAKASGGGR